MTYCNQHKATHCNISSSLLWKDTLPLLCYDQVLLLQLLDLAFESPMFIFQTLHWLFFLLTYSVEQETGVLEKKVSTLGFPRGSTLFKIQILNHYIQCDIKFSIHRRQLSQTSMSHAASYLASSSMRFAIRLLSSGQRSFKETSLLALLVSETTCVKER